MAATDLYERARRARERDIAFLFLMMSLEVLFNDGGPEISRRITQRCALLNGHTPAHRKETFETLRRLYTRRSRLVHGDLFDKGGVLAISAEDLSQATDLVRLSLLRFIALTPEKTKAVLMKSLDDAVFDPSVSGRLEEDVEGYWQKYGVDFSAAFDVG